MLVHLEPRQVRRGDVVVNPEEDRGGDRRRKAGDGDRDGGGVGLPGIRGRALLGPEVRSKYLEALQRGKQGEEIAQHRWRQL